MPVPPVKATVWSGASFVIVSVGITPLVPKTVLIPVPPAMSTVPPFPIEISLPESPRTVQEIIPLLDIE